MSLLAPATGTIAVSTATPTAALAVTKDPGPWALSLQGAFTSAVRLEVLYPGSATWNPVSFNGTPISFSTACREIIQEPVTGAQYRLSPQVALAGGVLTYRLD